MELQIIRNVHFLLELTLNGTTISYLGKEWRREWKKISVQLNGNDNGECPTLFYLFFKKKNLHYYYYYYNYRNIVFEFQVNLMFNGQ